MADSLDIFTGVLLTVVGLVVIYGSIAYRLIDLILIIGVIVTLFGLYKLLPAFIMRILNSRNSGNSKLGSIGENILGSTKSNSDRNQLKHSNYSDSKNNLNKSSKIKNGAKEISNLIHDSSEDNSKSVLKVPAQDNYLGFDENHKDAGDYSYGGFDKDSDYMNYDYGSDYKDTLSKQVFNVPSEKNHDSKNNHGKRTYAFLSGDDTKFNPDQVYFTPNYEKPMKVNRRPKRKSNAKINLENVPRRSKEISRALASTDAVAKDVTVFNDNGYSISPKQIEEEVIIPIHDVDLDSYHREPVYNLSQSENTNYNNMIYDRVDEDSYLYSEDYITPIHSTEDNLYDGADGLSEDYYENSVEFLDNVDNYNLDDGDENIVEDMKVSNIETSKEDLNDIESQNLINSNNDLDLNVGKTNTDNSIQSPLDSFDMSSSKDSKALDNNRDKDIIQIDPKNPESLPIPKLLNSYVICDKGILTSQQAFEEVARHSKEEIFLEAPTIKDMGESFLSDLSKLKSKIIIQDFDLEDMSYVLLLSSLIKKGVEIKTLPLVNSFNLIGDSSYALLISDSVDEDNFEYGAVYNDETSVNDIKKLFESSWKIAKELDINSALDSTDD